MKPTRSLRFHLMSIAVLVLATTVAFGASKSSSKVDLNSPPEKELEAPPGFGKGPAAKIIANRPYGSVDELSKAGLSAKAIDKLRSKVAVGGASSAGAATKESKAAAEPKK